MLKSPMDLGSHIVCKRVNSSQTSGGVPIQTIAGATEDTVKVTGDTIDRYQSGALADSMVLCIMALATLANDKSLKFAVEYQESANDSDWDTAIVVKASAVLLTGDGVSTEFEGQVEYALNLRGNSSTATASQPLGKRYIRFNITPDLTASTTDVASWDAVAVLGGFEQLPR